MSTNRKRLQLHLETLRNLNAEEIDHIRGGVVHPESMWPCPPGKTGPEPPIPWPPDFPVPAPDPSQANASPPMDLITGRCQVPMPRPKPWPRYTQAPRSGNGHCTGI
jgi:hypothetical protein